MHKHNFSELENMHPGSHFMIVGAGATMRVFHDKIMDYIARNKCITIGINNITHLLTPNYHLWTNNGRWKEFGECVKPESILLLGSHLKNLPKDRIFYSIDYTDRPDERTFNFHVDEYKTIRGYFRNAGVLAIMLAKIIGANKIEMVGIDGFTLKYQGNQHCYGSGNTDKNTDEICEEKDGIIYDALNRMKKQIKFSILTPTIYKNHYNGYWG